MKRGSTMQIQVLVNWLDNYLRYQDYPDFIINILQEVDLYSSERYNRDYLRKATGLMLRCGDKVEAVYCAVFPSDDLIVQLTKYNACNALLIIKHPMDWEELGVGFVPMSSQLLDEVKCRSISVYCAHAAHDNFRDCSPSKEMARNLPLTVNKAIQDENGRIFGYLAENTRPLSFTEFRTILTSAFRLPKIQERFAHNQVRRVAVVSGGGDNGNWLRIIEGMGCDTYLTGILYFRGSDYAQQYNPVFIKELMDSKLNAFGISHYFSERNGSIALAQSLSEQLGLEGKFLPEEKKEEEIRVNWGYQL